MRKRDLFQHPQTRLSQYINPIDRHTYPRQPHPRNPKEELPLAPASTVELAYDKVLEGHERDHEGLLLRAWRAGRGRQEALTSGRLLVDRKSC